MKQKDLDLGYQMACRAILCIEEAGFEARLAGGCVRDRCLGLAPKDYDIATKASPEVISLIFKQKNAKVIPTGIEHGTITVILAGIPLEITSLRRDVSTDGRRATVAFGQSFEEDAERRDFTFNAMFEDRQGVVYDFFQGREDLKAGRLQFVGDAASRIREDYLRILRLFRFQSRFGFQPDAPTLEACALAKDGLRRISRERVTHEFRQIFQGVYVEAAVRDLEKTGIFALYFSPQVRIAGSDFWARVANLAEPSRFLAAMSHFLGQHSMPEVQLGEWRLSRQEERKIALLISLEKGKAFESDQALAMNWLDSWEASGYQLLEEFFPLWKALSIQEKTIIEKWENFEIIKGDLRKSSIPINGKDLQEVFALKKGPQMGIYLSLLKTSFRQEKWKSQEEGLRWLTHYLEQEEK